MPKFVVGRFRDRLLLPVTALVVAFVASGSFFLAALYHVDMWFVFAAWNSILSVPLLIGDFRGHLFNYSFVGFLFSWLVITDCWWLHCYAG